MKKLVIGAVALVIVAQLLSTYYLNRRFIYIGCDFSYHLCIQVCDADLREVLDRNNAERLRAFPDFQQALSACGLPLDDTARQCRQDAERAFNERLARLDVSDADARERRQRCAADCRRQHEECRAGNAAAFSTGTATANVDVVGNITIDCVEGGAPCFKPVSDFCQRALGACDQCLALCGGGEWTVETIGEQLPLNTTLVAATDPSKNPRVLATSTTRGNQAVLNVPSNIKLSDGEKLYFGFSSQKKPGGPVAVRIHRGA